MNDAALAGFHHVAFTDRNLDASALWSEQLFDLETVIDEPGASNDGSPFRPDRTGLDHAAFAITTRDDMDVKA